MKYSNIYMNICVSGPESHQLRMLVSAVKPEITPRFKLLIADVAWNSNSFQMVRFYVILNGFA